MAAKAPKAVARNWATIHSLWFPIATLPSQGPVVLANVDKTVTWFLETPSNANVGHTAHERDPNGKLLFDGDQPQIEQSEVEPMFWTHATYVDDEGRPN